MKATEVEALLHDQLDRCEITVKGEGSNFDIMVIGDQFEGVAPVKRQQMVYAALSEHIGRGDIHAVNIRVLTPGQAAGMR